MKKWLWLPCILLMNAAHASYNNDDVARHFNEACTAQAWAACQSARYDLYLYNPKDPTYLKWRLTPWDSEIGRKFHLTVRVSPQYMKSLERFNKSDILIDSKYRADKTFFNDAENSNFWEVANNRIKEKYNNKKMRYTSNKYANKKAQWMERVMMSYLLQNDKKNSVAALNMIKDLLKDESEYKKYKASYEWAIKYWQSEQ